MTDEDSQLKNRKTTSLSLSLFLLFISTKTDNSCFFSLEPLTSLKSDHCPFVVVFFFLFSPVVVEPGSVARYNNVMSLLSHVVLVKVRALHRFTLHTRGALLLLLFSHKHAVKMIYRCTVLTEIYFSALLQVTLPCLLFPWPHPLARLVN